MVSKRIAAYSRGVFGPLALLAVGGLLAGFCNGLLGAGGGIVLVLLLSRVLPQNEESSRAVYANALCVMLPLSLATLLRYAERGVFSPSFAGELSSPYLIGAVAGGVFGGILLGNTRNSRLRKLFALLTLASGVLMITR